MIDLDNNATTKPAPEVIEAVARAMRDLPGNPGSIHAAGRAARAAVERGRGEIAQTLGCDPSEIALCATGSESDNLAIKGALGRSFAGTHVITSTVEHSAVIAACDAIEALGARVTRLAVDAEGRLDPGRVADAIEPATRLVTLMAANNETGVTFDIAAIARAVKAKSERIVVHTDLVQALGKAPVDVRALGVDLASIAAHKIHGPKGVAALYVRRGIKLEPLVHGGTQERRRRAGTEDVPGIVGFGVAATLLREHTGSIKHMRSLRDAMEARIRAEIPDARINGAGAPRICNTTNITFAGAEGEPILISLDLAGIAASSGSACTSGTTAPSHVLTAMGRSADEALGSIRLSLSRYTTQGEIDALLAVLPSIVAQVRSLVQ